MSEDWDDELRCEGEAQAFAIHCESDDDGGDGGGCGGGGGDRGGGGGGGRGGGDVGRGG